MDIRKGVNRLDVFSVWPVLEPLIVDRSVLTESNASGSERWVHQDRTQEQALSNVKRPR